MRGLSLSPPSLSLSHTHTHTHTHMTPCSLPTAHVCRYRKSKNEKALAALRPPIADETFEITETIEVFVREDVEVFELKIV